MESPKNRNIILIGFMGTGKSTVGQAIAETLNYQFVDTDALVEKKAGCAISEIFASQGEAHFRQLEHEVIKEILQNERLVVSTGGGSVLREDNCAVMLANGQVIALTADTDHIIQRVSQDPNRPLLQGNVEERVHTLMAQRKDAYQFADVTIDTTGVPVENIVRTIHEHHMKK
ncbi:shikimate kinase [Paenibacillus selenitireducens]|uniref:Shikimate kinase n=1 Tax=Paenibacillus selenitireducens TaxID=1324314 RepID=A0A1T2XF62_9BACL|nr:shikimate kinase [Paenibacillus selenitireducens]OPA78534.1 shikimate kinase [Paenibacillus selenitireducens]